MLELPKTKSTPVSELQQLTILIYGRPKVGKSTFCSQAPGAIFLATEPGLHSLSVHQMPVTSWPEMIEACNLIAKGGHEFGTIVIDTVDLAFRMCERQVCEENGVKHLADLKWGKGYALANNEFYRVLTKLGHLPYGVILTSHAVQIEVDDRTGKFNRTVPTLGTKARDLVTGMADIIMFADMDFAKDKDGVAHERRVLRTQPSKFWDAGDRTGRLPDTVELGWDAFAKAFEGGGK
jgi:hypothetical protein